MHTIIQQDEIKCKHTNIFSEDMFKSNGKIKEYANVILNFDFSHMLPIRSIQLINTYFI